MHFMCLACEDGWHLITLGSRQVCLLKWGQAHGNRGRQICADLDAVLPLPLNQEEQEDFQRALQYIVDSPTALLDITGKWSSFL